MIIDFSVNGKNYHYGEEFNGYGEKQSWVSEQIDPYYWMIVYGYPYSNSHPGIGKVKAWIKKFVK